MNHIVKELVVPSKGVYFLFFHSNSEADGQDGKEVFKR